MKKIAIVFISAVFLFSSVSVFAIQSKQGSNVGNFEIKQRLQEPVKSPERKPATPAIKTAKPVKAPEPSTAQAPASTKAPGKSFFNACSEFFSTFDRPFTRPGNKQNFCNATSDWLKNINKY